MCIAQSVPEGFFALGHRHEVDVAGHEAIGANGQAMAVGVPLEEARERFAAAIILEYIGAAIPALGHMVRISRNGNACYAASVLIMGQAGGEMPGKS